MAAASTLMPHRAARRSTPGRSSPPGNGGHGSQQRPLVFREQLVRPVDRRTQRSVAGVRRRASALQEIERAAEPVAHVADAQRADAPGRELEREWEAVEAAHDLRGVGGGGVREREVGARRRAWATNAVTAGASTMSAIGAASSGTGSGPRRTRCSAGRSSGSRDVARTVRLAAEPSTVVTRSRHDSMRCSQLSTTSTVGRDASTALAASRSEPVSFARSPSVAASASSVWRASEIVASSTTCTARPSAATLCRGLERQARLADAARADDRHQLRGVDDAQHVRELAITPDHRCRGSAPAAGGGRGRGRRRLRRDGAGGDVALELRERGRRVEPGLLGEKPPEVVRRSHGIGLPTVGRERADE